MNRRLYVRDPVVDERMQRITSERNLQSQIKLHARIAKGARARKDIHCTFVQIEDVEVGDLGMATIVMRFCCNC